MLGHGFMLLDRYHDTRLVRLPEHYTKHHRPLCFTRLYERLFVPQRVY